VDGQEVPATYDPATGTLTPDSPVADGAHEFSYTLTNAAGVESTPSGALPITIDTTTPTETANIMAISPDTDSTDPNPAVGTGTDFVTSAALNGGDGTLIISGTTSVANPGGDMVQVSFDGGAHWADATTWTGTDWSYQATGGVDDLSGYKGEGTYATTDVLVRVVSAAGVAGASNTSPQPITVDNTNPVETVTLDKISDGTTNADVIPGTSSSYIIDTGTNLTFSGKLNTALNSSGGSTETLWINLGDGSGWHQVTDFSTSTTWSYTSTASFADNSASAPYAIQLQVVDLAGNLGQMATSQLMVEVMPTETPTITSISPDTLVSDGSFGSSDDYVTATALSNKTTQTVTGDGSLTVYGSLDAELETYEKVQVSKDGSTWVDATVNSDGTTWSAIIPSVTDGNYTLQTRVINSVGNFTPTTSFDHQVVVDNTAPTQTITFNSITGGNVSDFTTDATSGVSIDATLSAGIYIAPSGSDPHPGVSTAQLQVSVDGGSWQNVPLADFSGNTTTSTSTGLSYTLPTLFGGDNYVQMRAVDSAGNVGQTYGVDIFVNNYNSLTQPYSNTDNSVYYAGDNPSGSAPMNNGVNLIATGPGNDDWVHGIGSANVGGTPSATGGMQFDSVAGGAGNDFIGIVGTNFTSVNGGNGWNTLVFEGNGIDLNLATMGLKVQGFAEFDLNNQLNNASTDPGNAIHPTAGQFVGTTSGNTLELSLADVISESNGDVNLSTQRMTILGDGTSKVVLDGTTDAASLATAGWTSTSAGTLTINGVTATFDLWHNSAATSTAGDLLIQHGVNVI
jgi:hypothetical protein